MAMMGWMRRTSRYFLVAVVVTFLASLAYWGVTQDRSVQESVASINGEPISAAAYQRAYRAAVEQYRRTLKESFSEDALRSLRLPEQVIERLTMERLVVQRAAAEGITVSDQELSDQITHVAAFQEDGRFSKERYVRLLGQAQLTPAAFEEDIRGQLLTQKFQALIADGVKVSDGEVRQRWVTDHERVRAAYIQVVPQPLGENIRLSEEELEAYYKGHAAEFQLPERRRVLAAILSSASVPSPAVTEADLQAAYAARRAEFEQPGRAHVAHILVRVPSVGGSQAEEGARAKAEAALQRIRGGTDFAQVAREVSEDTATASRGGDLGLVAPGELVPEFDKVIFGLKRGDVTGPLRTPFGYHVIKVFEVLPATKRDLKEVAPTLKATLAAEGQARASRAVAEEAQRALLATRDFGAEARRRGLTVREIGPLRRTDAVEGIGRLPEATDAIFALAQDGVSNAIKVPEGYVIFRLLERQAPRLQAPDEVRPEVMRAVRQQRGQEDALAKARVFADALRTGEAPAVVAKRERTRFGETEAFSRSAPLADKALGQAIAAVALALPTGGIGTTALTPTGFYVVKVLARDAADAAEFDRARRELETQILTRKRTQVWQAWLTALRGQAKVEINRKLLPEA